MYVSNSRKNPVDGLTHFPFKENELVSTQLPRTTSKTYGMYVSNSRKNPVGGLTHFPLRVVAVV